MKELTNSTKFIPCDSGQSGTRPVYNGSVLWYDKSMDKKQFETTLATFAEIDDGQKALVLWLQDLVFEPNYNELMEYYKELID